MGQTDFQFRMPAQIADRMNAEPVRFGAAHDERVGVVKAEFRRHADAELFQRLPHRFFRKAFLRFQDLLADRASVFRVKVDLSADQRLPENDGAAHAGTLLHGEAGTLDRRRRDLAEDIRFGEFLGADHERFRGQRRGRDQGEKKSDLQNAALLCALMNSVTNSFAGRSRRSATPPRWTIRPSFKSTISSAR